MLLAGVRAHHPFAGAEEGIAAQWKRFEAVAPRLGSADGVVYGVMCGHDGGGFEYMCAAEVGSFEGLPEGTGRMRVPPQRYAVFEHDLGSAPLRRGWERVLAWLEGGDHESAHLPDFERYEAARPGDATGIVEIWVGVVARLVCIVLPFLLLGGCSTPTRSPTAPGAPSQFEMSTGGFALGATTVLLRGDTLLVRKIPWRLGPEGADSARIVPSETDWRSFWTAAEGFGLRRWEGRYIAEGVVDGYGWEVRIAGDGVRVDAQGSNAFPDEQGVERELDMTPAFRAFLAAVETLIGASLNPDEPLPREGG